MYTAAVGPLALFGLLNVGAAGLLALSGLRSEGQGAQAELRPSPGVPVTRAFLRRTSLRLVGENLELRTSQNTKRLLRGPGDPVLGVREAVVLEEHGRPWAVALIDRREAVLAFLHWETWFQGDPQLTGLRAFCETAGIVVRRRAGKSFPGGPVNASDRTARIRGFRARAFDGGHYAFSGVTPLVCLTFPAVAVVRGLTGNIDWAPYYVMGGIAFGVAFLPLVVRAGVRTLWLDRLVPAEPVSEGRVRRKTAKEMRRG